MEFPDFGWLIHLQEKADLPEFPINEPQKRAIELVSALYATRCVDIREWNAACRLASTQMGEAEHVLANVKHRELDEGQTLASILAIRWAMRAVAHVALAICYLLDSEEASTLVPRTQDSESGRILDVHAQGEKELSDAYAVLATRCGNTALALIGFLKKQETK
jgi:hypothetical protein